MNNKLSELKYAADYWRKVKSGELPAPGPNEISITVCTLDGAVSRMTALLAELEAKDKRIAELERITEGVDQLAIDGGWTARGMSKYAKSLEDRLEKWQELASNQCIKINELQAKLATPVRLPDVLFIKDSGSAVPVMHATRVKERIRAAGFKCVGDE